VSATRRPSKWPAGASRSLARISAIPLAAWAASVERRVLERGIALEPELIDFARRLGIDSTDELRFEITPRIPLPVPGPLVRGLQRLGLPLFEPAGMALGRAILARQPDPAMLRHELVHCLQYQRLGGIRPFLRQYLFECLHHGYHAAPLEIEARQRAAAGA